MIGEIVKGRVIAVIADEEKNGPKSLLLKIQNFDIHEGTVPVTELGEEIITPDDVGRRRIARKYVGRVMVAKVIGENPLVLSYIQAKAELAKSVSLEPGEVVEGTVVWVGKRQAELEYNSCVPMLLPASEFSKMFHIDLTKTLIPGETLKVEILKIEDNVITCSHKKFAQDPWPKYTKKYHTKSQWLGRVERLLQKGVIVSLEPGLDIFTSPYPFFDVKIGDEVAVEITDVNSEAGKMRGFITSKAALAVSGRR